MKKCSFIIIFACFCSNYVFAQNENTSIVGKWSTEEGKVISIVKQDNQFEGTTLDGAPILRDLVFENDAWHGTIQNRGGDRSAKCNIVMEDANKIKITARKGIFSKRFYWSRTK